MVRSFVAVALLATASQAAAQTAQGDVAVTIYNEQLALIQDTRTLQLPNGRAKVEFPDVSAQIRPETVSLAGAGIGIVEQNFDYDLLSPDKMMAKAVGQTITLVRTNPATGAETREQAKVLAANGGIVLQIGNRIEVLRDDGLPVRVVFDKVPDNLRARPTLSVTLQSAQAGSIPARLSYLTPGLGWKADYVALFDEKAQTIDVQGWVTLTNNTGTTFSNAKTLLVAGLVNQVNQNRYGSYPQPQYGGGMDVAGTESAARGKLGDYYLYPLAERTTIANAQTKQVGFLDVAAVPAKKSYQFVSQWLQVTPQPMSVSSVLKFSSSAQGGLGDALPAGTVRVYMRDAQGNPQFVGENSIGHTPMGSSLSVKTGEAFDVKVATNVVKRERLSSSRWVTSMSYTLTNAGDKAVTVDLAQDGLWGDVRIKDQSREGKRISADRVEWAVPVPANGSATVTATFDSRW
ncbi:MAG: DUF4139 domain-containing protein [Sphingomonadales bacterium]|nr:DUF4139 domain-containing protein [Sphingomonadales bacterium]